MKHLLTIHPACGRLVALAPLVAFTTYAIARLVELAQLVGAVG